MDSWNKFLVNKPAVPTKPIRYNPRSFVGKRPIRGISNRGIRSIVEIDEAVFFKRKYIKERLLHK